MSTKKKSIRLGADIGGTFTDLVLAVDAVLYSTKVLTNYSAPEQAILDGAQTVLAEAGLDWADLDLVIHGTTLATNALIERRGAKVAFVTTEGFRDTIEMRTESRFDQYDLNLKLPAPLVPREDRFAIRGRMGAAGQELAPLDEAALFDLADTIVQGGYQSVAIGFIHSYVNGAHERRAREILSSRVAVPISISSEVSPQMREYERFNTVCANAYVRPQMADYLTRFQKRLKEMGAVCPIFMIHSGGGLISVETAAEFPVRLVESGPAGGAIFAADVARRFGLNKVVSYDMGGTTAKICLIENFAPRTARSFEVARSTRFAKGSGMPISIPVIEMIEIGAGGGSLAWVDAMGRIQTGPESAGSEPGPACYQRGGERPAITDADLVLGKLDPKNFAGGAIELSTEASETAIGSAVGQKLGLTNLDAAFGICEVVDENMANAARVHAVENGKDIAENIMVAFGGAAPLHAARLCEKLSIDQCLIPMGAGVGSAIGFLRAPFGYEALASQVIRLSAFDAESANRLVQSLKSTASGFVARGDVAQTRCEITAFMRYSGQGWEIPVPLADRPFAADEATDLRAAFQSAYAQFFGRAIEGLEGVEVEIVTLSVKIEECRPRPSAQSLRLNGDVIAARQRRMIFDPSSAKMLETAIFSRSELHNGARIVGPAVIVERETSTVITAPFEAVIQEDGSLLLIRKESVK